VHFRIQGSVASSHSSSCVIDIPGIAFQRTSKRPLRMP